MDYYGIEVAPQVAHFLEVSARGPDSGRGRLDTLGATDELVDVED